MLIRNESQRKLTISPWPQTAGNTTCESEPCPDYDCTGQQAGHLHRSPRNEKATYQNKSADLWGPSTQMVNNEGGTLFLMRPFGAL